MPKVGQQAEAHGDGPSDAAGTSRTDTYNYARWAGEHYGDGETFEAFDGPVVGERLPRVEVRTPTGDGRDLHDLTDGGPAVVESGSVTCPVYVGKVGTMNDLAHRFPDATFAVLYTREAHPGSRIGPHRTFPEKMARARQLVQEEGEGRLVLVDDLDGTAHRALGSLPNFVYVCDADGTVVHRQPWADPAAVEEVLRRLTGGQDPSGVEAKPRWGGLRALVRTMRRAGWNALGDILREVPRLAPHLRRFEGRQRGRDR